MEKKTKRTAIDSNSLKKIKVDESNTKVLLLDIEGTTTKIEFVKEILFPYVRKNVINFLSENCENEQIKRILSDLKDLSIKYKENDEKSPTISDENCKNQIKNFVFYLMDLDKKESSLKELQGKFNKEKYCIIYIYLYTKLKQNESNI